MSKRFRSQIEHTLHLYEILEQAKLRCDDRNQNNLQQWGGGDWQGTGKNFLGAG